MNHIRPRGQARESARHMTGLALIAWALLTCCLVDQMQAQTVDGDAGNRPVVFLGNESLPPMSFMENGKPAGIVVDLARAMAERMHRPVEIRLMNWAEAQELVLKGRADALIQINPSPERLHLYDFSEPLLSSEFTIFTSAERLGISSMRGLRGLKVGVEETGLPDLLLREDPEIALQIIPDFTHGFKMLERGKVDAVVADRWVGSYVVAKDHIRGVKLIEEPIGQSDSAIAVKKGNTDLLQDINAALADIRQDSTYDRVINSWRSKEVVFKTREQLREQGYLIGAVSAALIAALAGILVLVREIRRRKRMEQALRESEGRLRFHRERMPIGCIVHDEEFRFVEVNPAAERIFGYRAEELIGRHIRVLVPPEARPHVDGILGRLVAGDMTAHSVNENLTRDNRIILCDWLNTPLKDSDGKFLGLLSMVQDITERKRTEDALRQSEAHFRALAEALPQIVWTSDAEGGIEWFNQRWYEYTGEPQGVGEGWSWDKVSHPEDMARTLQNWHEARRRGELFENEIRIRCLDGEYRWFLVRAWPLKDTEGDVVRWVGTNADIHDLKEAEHRLERENREIALINRILRVFAETSDDELFDRVLEMVQEGLASRHGVFGYIEKPGHLVCPSLSKMLDECEIEGKCIHYPPEKWKGLWARALLEKRSLCSNKPSRVPAGHPAIRNNLAAPILFRGEVIGLLNLANKDGDYTDTDRLLLEAMADRIAPLLYAWIQKKLRQNEQDEARDALREANERYELVLTGSGAALWDWDVVRHKVLYSPRWKAMRGFKEDEITDSEDEWSRGIHPEDVARVMAAVQAHFEGKTAFFDAEYRVCRRDGSWLWIADRGLARRDVDGRVVRMAGSEIDISERKQAEAELRAAEELARQRLVEIEDIYHNAPVGLCVLDRDLRFVRINERLAEINGIPSAEHVGKTVRDLLPELADTVELEMRRILATGEPRLNIEIVGETPAQPGVKRSWQEQWLPITDAHGQTAGLSIVVEETTERMRLLGEIERSRDELEARVEARTAELAQAYDHLQETARALAGSEEKLRRNNELLQKVFDGISDPLLMLDGSGLVTMINRAGLSYYAVGEEAHVVGKPCFEGLAGRDAPCPECAHPFFTTETRTISFERNGLKDPGKVENVTIYPVLDQEQRREAVIIRICDITQAKILEKQIIQNEKLAALGLVTSGIAHEINNPNSFIYFNLPILRDYLEALLAIVDEHVAIDPDLRVLNMSYGELREDIFRLLENMQHGSQRISKTISMLKNFIRKRDVEGMQRVDLKQLVEKVVALCHTELRQKLSSFEILVPDDLPSFVSDPEALEQVLMNLVINAIHACDKPDSRVQLKIEGTRPGSDQIIIGITDNGSGINEAVRERIFDPFFTTKAANEGTGLGLYICHNQVTSLGGRIEVESKVGKGTTFRVVLPTEGRVRLESVPAGCTRCDS